MGDYRSIRGIPTPLLRAMRDVCPKKASDVSSLQISYARRGEAARPSIKITYEARQRINAELKRRRAIS